MNILIIGSKGFIGSNLKYYFESKNYNVYSADVVHDYVDKNYTVLDITNSDYHSIFEQGKFDVCINCSGAASVPLSNSNPYKDFNLNTVNVFKILDAIKKYQPECKFINMSSAAVYGNPERLPITENQPISPVSPYGLHKKMAEDVCTEFNSMFGIKTCSLRIFSAYGDSLKKQLFWDLYKKAEADSKIELFGTGNESRDFIYIKDLVRVIELVMFNAHFNAETINVANGKEIYIKDAVKFFYSNFTKNIDYSFSGENRQGDPINWVADISKIAAMGYKPEYDIEKGLQLYYNWIINE